MLDLVRFSIITVVRNAREELIRTIRSVSEQTYSHQEFIVIDGNSTDGTLEAAKSNSLNIDHLKSEPDKGLYDAMNKGIALATGSYLIFLNAGDVFPHNTTLDNLSKTIVQNKFPDFVYGDSIEIPLNGKRYLRKARPLPWMKIGMITSHQSMYYKRQVLEDHHLAYDLSYKILSDYNFTWRFLKASGSTLRVEQALCEFKLGGISTKNWYAGLLEIERTRKTVLGMARTERLLIHCAQIAWHLVKYHAPIIHRLLRYEKGGTP